MAKAAKKAIKPKNFNFPKLHFVLFPGKFPIGLDSMLDGVSEAEFSGVRFDGVDLFLSPDRFELDRPETSASRLTESCTARNLQIGTLFAPLAIGGSVLADFSARETFLDRIRKTCSIGRLLRDQGIRPNGCIRIETACSIEEWEKDPVGSIARISELFNEACEIAAEFDEVLAVSGDCSQGGTNSWRRVKKILDTVERPQTLGFQVDMLQSFRYLRSDGVPEDRLLPGDFDGKDRAAFDQAYRRLAGSLRLWTVDFHIAQTDPEAVNYLLPDDPSGIFELAEHAGCWLKDEDGLTKRFNHFSYSLGPDGDESLFQKEKLNKVLETMVSIRNKYGWK